MLAGILVATLPSLADAQEATDRDVVDPEVRCAQISVDATALAGCLETVQTLLDASNHPETEPSVPADRYLATKDAIDASLTAVDDAAAAAGSDLAAIAGVYAMKSAWADEALSAWDAVDFPVDIQPQADALIAVYSEMAALYDDFSRDPGSPALRERAIDVLVAEVTAIETLERSLGLVEPAPSPTPKPKPTKKPAKLKFGKITYSSTACWNSSWEDGDGHRVGGVKSDMAVTVRNKGGMRSDPVWVAVRPVSLMTDMLPTNKHKKNWTRYRLAGGTVLMRGPRIKAGGSKRLRWDMVFLTPFDARYEVIVLTGFYDKVVDGLQYGDWLNGWELWTVNRVC